MPTMTPALQDAIVACADAAKRQTEVGTAGAAEMFANAAKALGEAYANVAVHDD